MTNDINEKLKVLGIHERIKILEYITGVSKEIPKEMAVLTAEVLLYRLCNKNSLPTELNPYQWNLPE